MMTSLLMLGLAYALVAALLLALCIGLEGRRLLKISLIVLVSAFYSVTWLGHQSMLGWATSEDMPDAFRVLWITIDEPDKATKEAGGIFFGYANWTKPAYLRAHRVLTTCPLPSRLQKKLKLRWVKWKKVMS